MEVNFLKASSFIRSAALKGADLAVLPEFHLSGWTPNDSKFIALASKWEIYLSRYQSLAKECNINIVPGTILQASDIAENQELKVYNVAYFISNEGEVIGSYTKKNLW